jgi:hypothetical protein
MKFRQWSSLAIIFVGSLILVFALLGLPYTKFSAINSAWADNYKPIGQGGTIVCRRPINASVARVLDLRGQSAKTACVTTLQDWNYYSLDSVATFGVPCQNICAYRETDHAWLIVHPFICNGDTINFLSVGTGTYVLTQCGAPQPDDITFPITANP